MKVILTQEQQENFRNNLQALMREKNVTARELSTKIDCGLSTVYNWLGGKRKITDYTVMRICSVFGVDQAAMLSADFSVGNEVPKEQSAPDEISKPDGKRHGELLVLANVSAGTPELNFEDGRPFDEIAGIDDNCFMLRVTGDSMTGDYVEECIPNGAYVLMTQQGISPEHCIGKVVYAAVDNGEYSLKELRVIKNEFFLVPWNKRYRPIKVTENTRILGRMLGWFVKV